MRARWTLRRTDLALLGVYAAYGALSLMNLISGSCSSDNAAGEGFISHRDWSGRIKESLGWMGPNEYRRSLGCAL